ncbi:MAG: WbqC family protein [Acetivibrionales bacterium]
MRYQGILLIKERSELMRVAVHQPNYIPWMGYFYKIYKSDVFVILDDVQYVKRSFINRNKIKTHRGELWLTVPVSFTEGSRCKINRVNINNEQDWKHKHLQNIEINYKKSAHFNEYFAEFKSVLMQDWTKLSDLNIVLIKNICKVFGIGTDILCSSQLEVEGDSTERIINICKTLGADEYLSGSGGAKYQDEGMYHRHNIKLVYSNFVQEPYQQLWGDYIRNLSIIDYMFNCGLNIRDFWERTQAVSS